MRLDKHQDGISVKMQVKYLSAPGLLRLQLQDGALRRHVLIQALLLLHACNHPGKNEKEAMRAKQVLFLSLSSSVHGLQPAFHGALLLHYVDLR